MSRILKKPHTSPMSKPKFTSCKACWRRMRRLVPTHPAISRVRQSHHVGSKRKMMEKASRAPTMAPAAAEWVLMRIQLLISAHIICRMNAPARMLIMMCGMCIRDSMYRQHP